MTSLRVLVVDDEPLIRTGIKRALAAMPAVEVVGECGCGREAIAAIASGAADVVLLDVQMPDCSGLDVVRAVGPSNMPGLIFVTAYDEHAVAAFELNAVDYVLKPFTDVRLGAALARARQRLLAADRTEVARQLRALLAGAASPTTETLVVRDGERFDFVPIASIEWIEAANNYVLLHCGSRSHLMAETLTALEARLDAREFVRIHRGRIVNRGFIVAAHAMAAGAYEIELRSGVRLGIGRQYRGAVQSLLGRRD